MNDGWGDWVLRCIGVYDNGEYLDEMEKKFGVSLDWSDDETIDHLNECLGDNHPQLGNRIASYICEAVIERAVDELGANAEDFDYCCNGAADTNIMYKDEEVYSWDDIVEIHTKTDKN